jgi:hypothetical protein
VPSPGDAKAVGRGKAGRPCRTTLEQRQYVRRLFKACAERHDRGMLAQRLADELGVSVRTIERIVGG